jgi:hypothetical protein
LRILVFDHFFKQDIDALVRSSRVGDEIRVVDYEPLRNLARRFFPDEVFRGLSEYPHERHQEARSRYAVAAEELLCQVREAFRFDVVVSPSDTFFYLRPWVTTSRQMGVPFVVLQKETTISPYTMTEHARAIRESVPFISDRMLVCSERHREFWLNAGANPAKVAVTGQPRFDFYARKEWWLDPVRLGLGLDPNRPTVLFFSYDLRAYAADGNEPAWGQLRCETEEVLLNLAAEGALNLLIKPHPQQRGLAKDVERLRTRAGLTWGSAVQLLEGESDARQLIVNADVVVGFQTTALFEAMAAGKQVIYTWWSEPAHRYASGLIPFHLMQDALDVACSPTELHSLCRATDQAHDPERLLQRRRAFDAYLGPLDGRATERALREIRDLVEEASRQRAALRADRVSGSELQRPGPPVEPPSA